MYKIGDKVRIKHDSKSWTNQYAGEEVEITQILTKSTSTVMAKDGYKFFCPNEYFYQKSEYPPCISTINPVKCTCGAHKTWGKDCPGFFHFDYCDFYKPKGE